MEPVTARLCKDDPGDVPNATYCPEGVTWERQVGHYHCGAVSGAFMWRSMVVDLRTDEIVHITPHFFTKAEHAMGDADAWVRKHGR